MSDHERAREILRSFEGDPEHQEGAYLLARICAALERIADAQETIAATPFEGVPSDLNTWNSTEDLAAIAEMARNPPASTQALKDLFKK